MSKPTPECFGSRLPEAKLSKRTARADGTRLQTIKSSHGAKSRSPIEISMKRLELWELMAGTSNWKPVGCSRSKKLLTPQMQE